MFGAILVTLYPGLPLDARETHRWREPPPEDAVERRLGRPHLTWIFVSTMRTGVGVGSALLGNAFNALQKLGYRELASSFLSGDSRSILWHWRNGFELGSWAGSMRKEKLG